MGFLLPELAGSDRLIGQLAVFSPVLTPNGDSINDQITIDFVVYKMTAAEPQVHVCDIPGSLVAELTQQTGTATHRTFTWAGLDQSGSLVSPGLYLCRIDLDAESGEDTALQTFTGYSRSCCLGLSYWARLFPPP